LTIKQGRKDGSKGVVELARGFDAGGWSRVMGKGKLADDAGGAGGVGGRRVVLSRRWDSRREGV
jgi:hypothetical protein